MPSSTWNITTDLSMVKTQTQPCVAPCLLLLGSGELLHCLRMSVTESSSSRRPESRSVHCCMQDSLSMVESWRKVILGLSMIKLTPHRVSQIRFCALDTLAAAYSTVSRVQSHLSCWHHCIAITVSERENALGLCCGKTIKAIGSLSLFLMLCFQHVCIADFIAQTTIKLKRKIFSSNFPLC